MKVEMKLKKYYRYIYKSKDPCLRRCFDNFMNAKQKVRLN